MQLADIQGGRSTRPGTSSANPVKLRRYAQDGIELVTALQPKATAVVQSIEALAQQGYTRSLGDAHFRFQDLAADWYHLDEFAGDVADGFFRASGPGQSLDGLVGMDDAQLAQLGRLGYADRDQAKNEAHRLAAELDRLRRGERVNVRALFNAIRRAQYDPAFAVTFSERIGVRGYVEAAAMLRGIHYTPSGDVSAEGVAALRALSGTLTTALDTLPNTLEAERHDPGNAGLLYGQRLSGGFVGDLMSGYQPDPSAMQPFGSPANEADLAALVGFTDPPTAVAVGIANSRMLRRLTMHYDNADTDPSQPNAWGRKGGLISAYADMLSRNDDAAAHFLGADGAIEGAIRRREAYYVDGGAAVGDLVEAGLTHENPVLREPLMHRAITEVARLDEIRGPHMVDALAAGVDANMSVIDERINQGWNDEPRRVDEDGNEDGGLGDRVLDTHDFLREVMIDEDAMRQVSRTLDDYIRDEMLGLTTDPAERQRTLEENGRLLGVFTQAEANAILEVREGEQAQRLRDAGRLDSIVGLLPYAGQANSVADILFDKSAGDILYPGQAPIDDAQQRRADIFDEARLNTWMYIAMDAVESGAYDPAEMLATARATPGGERDFLTGQPGDPNRSVLPIEQMTEAQKDAFANWLFPDEREDGPFAYGTQARRDRNDLTTGLADTALSELMDRTEN